MKKIFSLSLMAVALLISGNAKAATAINNFAELQSAFKNGGDCYLNASLDITSTLVMYAKFNEPGKVLNLNLNGKTLTATTCSSIEIFKGTLNLTNTVNGELTEEGGIVNTSLSTAKKDAIILHGVYDDKENWTNLNVGKGVHITSSNYNAISILEFYGFSYYAKADKAYAGKLCDGTDGVKLSEPQDPEYSNYAGYKFKAKDKGNDYSTSTGREGLTAGRIMQDGTKLDWTSSYVKYKTEVTNDKLSDAGIRNYVKAAPYAKANGVNVKIEGTVYGQKYGIKVNGTLKNVSTYQPNIEITRDAKISCATTTDDDLSGRESIAVYCSGQANWVIEGRVEGNIGVVILSGNVVINDAVIYATGTNYTPVTFESDKSGISSGSGCAIIVDSRSNYGGQQSITISGDSYVVANTGMAIVETTTTADNTKVSNINIEGGTFEGGEAGAMEFSNETAQTKITITSGNINGDVKIEGEVGKTTEEILEELMPQGTYAQEIDGKQVITTGAKPEDCADINTATANSNIALAEGTQTLTSDKVLGTVEMLKATTLTLNENVTLTVKKLVMAYGAQIIVPYNSALIVNGNEGAYTVNEDNIVLQAEGDQLATFIFSANVVTNKQPMATVEYNATAKEYGDGEYDYNWNRMTSVFESLTDYATLNKNDIDKYAGKSWKTYFRAWDAKSNAWVPCEIDEYSNPVLSAYEGIALTNVSANGDAKYAFKGILQGAKQGVLEIKKGWNYFGNSYTAKMDIKELLKQMPKSITNIKVFNATTQSYEDTSVALILKNMGKVHDIPAMQTFFFWSDEEATIDLDYEKLVWDYFNK